MIRLIWSRPCTPLLRTPTSQRTWPTPSHVLTPTPLRRFGASEYPPPSNPESDAYNEKQIHRLKLTPEQLRRYEKSIFGHVPAFFQQKDVGDVFKSLFIYRNYIWPSSSNPKQINSMIYRIIFYLCSSRFFALTMPLAIRFGIDKVIQRGDFTQVLMAFGAYAASSLLSTVLDNRRFARTNKLGQIVWHNLSHKAFEHLLNSDWSRSTREFKLFAITLERMRKGIQQHYGSLANTFIPMVVDLTINSLALWVFCGPIYFFNLMVTLVAYTWVTVRFSKKRQPLLNEVANLDKLSNNLANDTMNNHININTFQTQEVLLARYTDWSGRRLALGGRNRQFLTDLALWQRVVLTAGTISNMIICVTQVYQGTQTAGTIVLLNSLMTQILTPLMAIGGVYLRWQESFIDINGLLEISETDYKIEEKPHARPLYLTKGIIKFRNPIKHFSATFPSKSTICVTGPSNIGKVNIMHLLTRYMDPASGSIFIDNQDIRNVSLSFRRHFSICPCNPTFLSDTIISNLRMANPEKYFMEVMSLNDSETGHKFNKFIPRNDFVEPEIVELLRHFGIYEKIVSLPGGFQYILSDPEEQFTRADRQKLAWVRAFLKEADFYIFDEPTNFLDNSQFPMFSRICQAYKAKSKTIIVISHELSIAKEMDFILCFEKNGNFEFGTHDNLMQAGRNYSKMYKNDHF